MAESFLWSSDQRENGWAILSSLSCFYLSYKLLEIERRVFDQRLDGLLLHVREQIDHDLTATLHHPKDWGSFLLHRAASTFPSDLSDTWFQRVFMDISG